MSTVLQTLFERARAWFAQAQAAGWLDEDDVARLAAVEHGTPGQLFVDEQARPLVVAFFGGTGVGKSSLLNRLAGATIARTSAERPTSREATLYVHESVKLADLPDDLPVECVRIQRHGSDVHRSVLWIDAPDIDSTEEENRRAALAWLPHVDLVCYVVSPERYRDDVGWRILKQRGGRHGWMFVINRWDEGDARQRGDFARLLAEAGFGNPVLLTTSCLPDVDRVLPSPDEFDTIQANLAGLVNARAVEEFTRLGHRARLLELRCAIESVRPKLGTKGTWAEIGSADRQRWTASADTILAGAEWALRMLAARCASLQQGNLNEITDALWDDWAESKLRAYLDATELALRRTGVSVGPCRQRLDLAVADARSRVAQQVRDHVRAGLAWPGSPLVRAARRVARFLTALLPVMALLWVAWAIVVSYHRAVMGTALFRGTELAIHSILVVLIAWALPFSLERLLRPSVEKIALRLLRAGLRAGLDDVGQQLARALAAAAAEVAGQRQACEELLTSVTGLLQAPRFEELPEMARLVGAGATPAPAGA